MNGQLCCWPEGAVSEHMWRNCRVRTRGYLAIYNKLTSNTNVRYTVEKPRSALKTDGYLHTPATNTSYQVPNDGAEHGHGGGEEVREVLGA